MLPHVAGYDKNNNPFLIGGAFVFLYKHTIWLNLI